jgi:hypothetical protein
MADLPRGPSTVPASLRNAASSIERALVHRPPEHDFVGLLQLGQCERLSQKERRQRRVLDLASEPEKSRCQDLGVIEGQAPAGGLIDLDPLRISRSLLWRTLRAWHVYQGKVDMCG